jgi:hypothetical protein
VLRLTQREVSLGFELLDFALDRLTVAPGKKHSHIVFRPASNMLPCEVTELNFLMLCHKTGYEKISMSDEMHDNDLITWKEKTGELWQGGTDT